MHGPHLRRNCPRSQHRFIPHKYNSFMPNNIKSGNDYRYNAANRRVQFKDVLQFTRSHNRNPRRNHSVRVNAIQPSFSYEPQSANSQSTYKGLPLPRRPRSYRSVNGVLPGQNYNDDSDIEEALDEIRNLTLKAPINIF